mmetsp:Transcript_25033/g.70052  ORF Transcript_25033/g.70052 Transcript_25033/m.70052 type:complete len:834 (+) Transcript_25033:671-3172(+)
MRAAGAGRKLLLLLVVVEVMTVMAGGATKLRKAEGEPVDVRNCCGEARDCGSKESCFVCPSVGKAATADESGRPLPSSLAEVVERNVRIEFPAFKAPRLTICVLGRNLANVTYLALRAIRGEVLAVGEGMPTEVVLIDNGSTDKMVLNLVGALRNVKVVMAGRNLHWSAGNNLGFGCRAATSEYTLFWNNDAIMQPGFLAEYARVFREDRVGKIGAVGCRIMFGGTQILQEAGSMIFQNGGGNGYGRMAVLDEYEHRYMFTRAVDYVSGACMAVRNRALLEAGLIDAKNFPTYYSDTDLCLALRWKQGLDVHYTPFAAIDHLESASYGSEFARKEMKHYAPIFWKRWSAILGKHMMPPDVLSPATYFCGRHAGGGRTLLFVVESLTHALYDEGSQRQLLMWRFLTITGDHVTVLPLRIERSSEASIRTLGKLGIEVVSPIVQFARTALKRAAGSARTTVERMDSRTLYHHQDDVKAFFKLTRVAVPEEIASFPGTGAVQYHALGETDDLLRGLGVADMISLFAEDRPNLYDAVVAVGPLAYKATEAALAHHFPRAVRVYDAGYQDVGKVASFLHNENDIVDNLARYGAEWEREGIAWGTIVLAADQNEVDLLRRESPHALKDFAVVHPPMNPVGSLGPESSRRLSRRCKIMAHASFTGPLGYDKDPILHLLREAIPAIPVTLRKEASIELLLFGEGPIPSVIERELKRLQLPYSHVTKRSGLSYSEIRLVVAAHTTGPVLPKVTDAVRHGVPVIVSPLAAAAYDWTAEQGIVSAGSFEVLAKEIELLFRDENVWNARRESLASFAAASQTTNGEDRILAAFRKVKPLSCHAKQ